MNQLQIDIPHFLKHDWQQQPRLFKGAFTDFDDPISPDELAGLALEDGAAARMIHTKADHWLAQDGAPEDYSPLGDNNWQLLVQAINHFVDDGQQLARQFRFLPDWRFDDLMASFAVEGGGVGPHIDNYDVFIIQGQGKRHWQVGDRGDHPKRADNSNMSLVADFEPIIDMVMEPGDLLYIPVGFPHCGRSLVPSLSYSVGFRAPSQQELLSALADVLVDNNLGEQRYQQADDNPQPSQISTEQQQGFAALVSATLNGDGWQQALGCALSQNRFELALEPQAIDAEQLLQALQAGAQLQRTPGVKCLQVQDDRQTRLFIDGQIWVLPSDLSAQAAQLAQSDQLSWPQLAPLCQQQNALAELLSWVQQGYWYLD
ncbi:cupin domain-containing protein [uncultured Ferrimonas sp.]|uniref:JmjC domain-containing protein n=1 Tax=uncultured Ferrimonas sp. TaxID=432640 RepID=UPI002623F838|nr:cupin domain-containing protein [uncultured Ferrimonas sp.]